MLNGRKRTGSVDFSNIKGIEGGKVTENLIGQF